MALEPTEQQLDEVCLQMDAEGIESTRTINRRLWLMVRDPVLEAAAKKCEELLNNRSATIAARAIRAMKGTP